MKSKTITQKLVLNRTTIAVLDAEQKDVVMGGLVKTAVQYCLSIKPFCNTANECP